MRDWMAFATAIVLALLTKMLPEPQLAAQAVLRLCIGITKLILLVLLQLARLCPSKP